MKKHYRIFIGLLVVLSLSAYTFLCHAQVEGTNALTNSASTIIYSLEEAASPDVSMLRHVVEVLLSLLPAS